MRRCAELKSLVSRSKVKVTGTRRVKPLQNRVNYVFFEHFEGSSRHEYLMDQDIVQNLSPKFLGQRSRL